MFKACMFDLDGTLCNTLNSIAYFANSALRDHGYNIIPEEKYKFLVGNGADKLIRRMLKESIGSYTEDQVAPLRKTYDDYYESEPSKFVTVYPGMIETITSLKQNGIKTAVISNKPDDMTKAVINAMYPEGSFDHIQGKLDCFPTKPDNKAPLFILSKLSIEPEACLYIGDTDVDMKTGHNAGMKTVGVVWGFRGRDELVRNNADYIAEKAEDIFKIAIS
jgi:phosphoglycolate phosphatase